MALWNVVNAVGILPTDNLLEISTFVSSVEVWIRCAEASEVSSKYFFKNRPFKYRYLTHSNVMTPLFAVHIIDCRRFSMQCSVGKNTNKTQFQGALQRTYRDVFDTSWVCSQKKKGLPYRSSQSVCTCGGRSRIRGSALGSVIFKSTNQAVKLVSYFQK